MMLKMALIGAVAAIAMMASLSAGSESALLNELPVCDPGGPYGCFPMTSIQFDGRGSHDPDGTIVSYTWNFGDGQTGTGAVITHQYQSKGTYTVSLLVVDDGNLSSKCDTSVPVFSCDAENCPPVCDPGGPYYGVTGVPVEFDSSGSIGVVPCIPIVQYEWTFGDGTTATGVRPTHAYSNPGYFYVLLVVTDAQGATSACATEAVITGPTAVEQATWGRIKHQWRE